MSYNFSSFKQNTNDLQEWLKREFSVIRTGRASPAILDGISVEAYGSQMPINQVANISVEDARTIRIAPWDATQTKAIEKSIIASGLGLSVVVDGAGLRIVFPDLSADRRMALLKIAKQKLEDARVTLRGEREKVLKDVDAQAKPSSGSVARSAESGFREKAGSMSEDEKSRTKTELQKMVDDVTRKLDELLAKKEKEIAE